MNKLQELIKREPFGFLSAEAVQELVKLDRLFQVLVRCGGCRFTCAAQDVAHLARCIEAGGDYVRDVSFPVGSYERAANWAPEGAPVQRALNNADCGTAFPAHEWPSPKDTGKGGTLRRIPIRFHEADCGGAFDGNQVISDADPGL